MDADPPQSPRTTPTEAFSRDSGARDPLARVMGMGEHAVQVGLAIGFLVALVSHGIPSAKAATALLDMAKVVASSRIEVRDYLWATYDITTEKDKPDPEEEEEEEEDPPEPPPPEPEEMLDPLEPPPPTDEPPPENIYENDPPPAPAEAAKVLTANEDEMLDFTGDDFVSGDGDGAFYGQVSAQGTAKAPTYNPAATVGGTEGADGTGKPGPPPPPPGPDLSKPAGLAGGSSWNCPFPPEADAEQIDQAVAVVVVTVRPDGTPQAVQVISDPGTGFGRAARMCALGRRYTAGTDKGGNPTTTSTPPIRVRFTR